MKNLLKKFEIEGLLALLALALACVSMWGCGDKVSFEWGKYRSDESVAGFVNDSLVIVTDCRHWHEITEGWNGSYSEETSCGHDRMLIYNYRVQENGPRWTDSLTNKSGGYRWYQLTDSIIWRWEGKNFLLWKIGETAHEIKLLKKTKNVRKHLKLIVCISGWAIALLHWVESSLLEVTVVNMQFWIR